MAGHGSDLLVTQQDLRHHQKDQPENASKRRNVIRNQGGRVHHLFRVASDRGSEVVYEMTEDVYEPPGEDE